MRYFVLLLLALPVVAQTTEQPGIEYSSYTLLLVPQQGTGYMVGVDKEQKIVSFRPLQSRKQSEKTASRQCTTASCFSWFGNSPRTTSD